MFVMYYIYGSIHAILTEFKVYHSLSIIRTLNIIMYTSVQKRGSQNNVVHTSIYCVQQ